MKPVSRRTRGGAPTIRDVARRAGVSVATVSRVLNESPLVAHTTGERVRRAVDELGFRRSMAGRTLSVGRAEAVGVVVPFFTTPSVVERLRGVVAGLARTGYDLVLFDVEEPDQRADAMREFAQRGRVDGLVVVSLPLTEAEIDALERDGLPAILLDVDNERLPRIVVDDFGGGELAAAHLIAKGHTRIGFVGDRPDGRFGFTSSEDRRRGFRAALQRAGLDAGAALERLGASTREEARALAEDLLHGADRPTAVFAASDVQAIGVLEAAQTLGLRVPEDVAVMGFDDVDLADILGLTTVRQPLRDSGARAIELLLAAIEQGGRPPVREVQTVEVVERRTA